MAHRRIDALLPFYLTGKLSQTDAVSVRQHLAGCRRCQKTSTEWAAIRQGMQVSGGRQRIFSGSAVTPIQTTAPRPPQAALARFPTGERVPNRHRLAVGFAAIAGTLLIVMLCVLTGGGPLASNSPVPTASALPAVTATAIPAHTDPALDAALAAVTLPPLDLSQVAGNTPVYYGPDHVLHADTGAGVVTSASGPAILLDVNASGASFAIDWLISDAAETRVCGHFWPGHVGDSATVASPRIGVTDDHNRTRTLTLLQATEGATPTLEIWHGPPIAPQVRSVTLTFLPNSALQVRQAAVVPLEPLAQSALPRASVYAGTQTMHAGVRVRMPYVFSGADRMLVVGIIDTGAQPVATTAPLFSLAETPVLAAISPTGGQVRLAPLSGTQTVQTVAGPQAVTLLWTFAPSALGVRQLTLTIPGLTGAYRASDTASPIQLTVPVTLPDRTTPFAQTITMGGIGIHFSDLHITPGSGVTTVRLTYQVTTPGLHQIEMTGTCPACTVTSQVQSGTGSGVMQIVLATDPAQNTVHLDLTGLRYHLEGPWHLTLALDR